ncbi:hypothetical protein ACERK3_09555 [Phycisphaerales bacterium AB-hyl4]|uniref:Uncharacterized protein n=1 Tax=Natronomicrosphaera hydrolytica TaxID=3242702 RepID=A0ABV4U715_9BACT
MQGKHDRARPRVAGSKDPTRTRGYPRAGIELINAGPYDMDELVEIFTAADAAALRSGWVGCVVDAATVGRFSVGDLARALAVVADRLHPVSPSKETDHADRL